LTKQQIYSIIDEKPHKHSIIEAKQQKHTIIDLKQQKYTRGRNSSRLSAKADSIPEKADNSPIGFREKS